MFPKLTLFFPNENQHIEFLFIQTIEMRLHPMVSIKGPSNRLRFLSPDIIIYIVSMPNKSKISYALILCKL